MQVENVVDKILNKTLIYKMPDYYKLGNLCFGQAEKENSDIGFRRLLVSVGSTC
jgi:hypothetical protein